MNGGERNTTGLAAPAALLRWRFFAACSNFPALFFLRRSVACLVDHSSISIVASTGVVGRTVRRPDSPRYAAGPVLAQGIRQ